MKIKVLHNEKERKVLVSLRTHDYVSDGDVMIDGGQDGYVRYSIKEGWEYKEIDTSEIHQELCEFLKWGRNYDKEGNRLLETEFIQINHLETDHIEAILKTQKNINKIYKTVMEKELENREEDAKYNEDKIVYFAQEILTLVQDKFDEDEDFANDMGENLTEFMYAFSTVAPSIAFSRLTGQDKNYLEFNQLMNSLCFQFMNKD